MRPVPVVHIITRLELGGAQQNTLYTVASLDRSRYAPSLVCGPGGYLTRQAREIGVPLTVVPELVREIRPLSDRRAYRRIRKLLDRYGNEPYIVHTHSSKAGIVGRLAARRAGCPLIIHSVHGFGHTPAQPPWLRWALIGAEKAAARVTDHFITVSEANRVEGTGLGLFSAENSSLIRSGFDLALFRDARADRTGLAGEMGIPEDAPLALMVGNFKPQKNPMDFARVAARVARRAPEAHFLLTGEGELMPEVRRYVESRGLAGRFHMPGWREDVPQLLKGCRVAVLTSLWEGLPRVIPQAHAAGVPVVANSVDGCVEAVRDGVDGYLVRPGDVDAMAGRVTMLLADPERARAMGEAGSRTVDRFDQDLMVRQQEDLYQRLIGSKNL